MDFKVTPWEITGKVDYDKLIKRFGTKRITPKLRSRIESAAKGSDVFIRRDVCFSHRDFDIALNEYLHGEKFFLYTGRGPSGKMHIGHLVPMLFTKWLQDAFDANLYIQITDDEKFLFKSDATQDAIERYANDNILDIAAVGFNPDKTFIFKDTEYIGHIYPLVERIAKKINYTTVKAVFGFTDSTNIGMISFPAIEIAPTMFEKARCVIPASIDQDPYWRVQRDIAEDLGYKKTAALHLKLLTALTGPEGKMSASMPETAIYLSDTPEEVHNKIMKYAFSGGQETKELHRKLGGNTDIDVSFQWLHYFLEQDDSKLEKIRNDYRSGRMLSGELKEIVVDKINALLKLHNKRRESAVKLAEQYMYKGKLAEEMWSKTYR